MSLKSGIKIILSAIVLGVILIYAYARIQSFAQGPEITVSSPNQKSAASPVKLFSIEGVVSNASFITLNGRSIYTDEHGVLKERVLLAEGHNILQIEARDRFGRTAKKVLEIVYTD